MKKSFFVIKNFKRALFLFLNILFALFFASCSAFENNIEDYLLKWTADINFAYFDYGQDAVLDKDGVVCIPSTNGDQEIKIYYTNPQRHGISLYYLEKKEDGSFNPIGLTNETDETNEKNGEKGIYSIKAQEQSCLTLTFEQSFLSNMDNGAYNEEGRLFTRELYFEDDDTKKNLIILHCLLG